VCFFSVLNDALEFGAPCERRCTRATNLDMRIELLAFSGHSVEE